MSHIHIPDGILPLWLWLAGYVVIIIYLFVLGIYFKRANFDIKLPLVGVFAALMLIAMSVEIVPIGYHINLAVLSGIILGPVLSVLTIFVVTLILSFIGHGGITVVGLNTLTISIEALVGFVVFRLLNRKIKNIFAVTFISSIVALFISTCGTIGIVYLGTENIEAIGVHNNHSASGFINFELLNHHEEKQLSSLQTGNHNNNPDNLTRFDIKKFILLILGLGFIGWTLEAFITAFIVNYINKIKPDLLRK